MSNDDTLTSTIRCEVIKPVDMSWDSLGRMLRAFQLPLHRVVNNTITRLELAKPSGDETHPQTLAYRYVSQFWEEERAAARARIDLGKKIYSGDDAIAEIDPGSALKLGVAGLLYARWLKWNKEKMSGTQVMPTFRKGVPLAVASSSNAVSLRTEDGSYILSLRLLEGRGKRVEVVIRPYGGSGHAQMRELSRAVADEDGGHGIKLGDCRLVHEPARHGGKSKWMAMLSWTRPRPTVTSGHTMAVHRGIQCLLACAIDRGTAESTLAMDFESGGDIVAHKQAYEARRRSLGKHRRALGEGARGHGVDRREEHITRLMEAEDNWVRTRCQQAAVRVIRLAQQRGVSKILIEDWSNPICGESPDGDDPQERLVRSFPFAQLKECILWAAKRAGIQTAEVTTYGHSRTCPKCRSVGTVIDGYRGDRLFKCVECQLIRNVDAVAAWNMLVEHAGASGEKLVKDANNRSKRAAGKVRK